MRYFVILNEIPAWTLGTAAKVEEIFKSSTLSKIPMIYYSGNKYRECDKLRKSLVLTGMLILLMMVSALGCTITIGGGQNTSDPDLGNNSVPEVVTPGDGTGDPQEDNDPAGFNTAISAPVTLVPANYRDSIIMAVIRHGDLWLGTEDGRMWRQTSNDDVLGITWAPDGHALAYSSDSGLFALIPGNDPIKLDDYAAPARSWSPDSSSLAYTIDEGTQLRITRVSDLAQSSLLLDAPAVSSPTWLTRDRLIYQTNSEDERPSLIILNTMGDVISTLPDMKSPLLVGDGLVVAIGEYDPDGIMETFYSTGLAYMGLDGSNPKQIYDHPTQCSVISWHPGDQQYLAISTSETLFLQKYAGFSGKAFPDVVELLNSDVYCTYSEFSYPFWFAWAPGGSCLAALRFALTRPGNFGEQEGIWDLIRVDRNASQEMLLEEIYSVSGVETPLPFQGMPICWSPSGRHVNYLAEGFAGNVDLWRVNIAGKTTELVLENCGLPLYRP